MNLKEPLMFPCRQKINFILHVFFDILQRYWKSQSDTKACEYMSISAGKKSPSSTTFSVNIAKICKLCIWGTLGMSGYAHPKRKYQFVENLGVFLHAKITLHHSLLSWILQFDWSTAFWPIELELCKTWDWWCINNNIGFHFTLFPGKPNDRIFKKSRKLFSEVMLDPFCPHLGKNKFLWKNGYWGLRFLSVFKYSFYLPWSKKSGKTNDPFLRKMPNWRTGRQKIGNFIGNEHSIYCLQSYQRYF